MNLNIRLDEYCESVRDGTHDTPKPTSEGFPLVTSKAIKNNKIDFDACYFISEDDYNKINKRSKVDTWDVLMTMIGTVGRLLLVKDIPSYAIKNIALFKVNDEYKAKWLYYYLSTKNVQDYFEMIASGTSQHFIGLGHLRKLKITDYRSDSKQIVDTLSTYDELIENNNKRIAILEQMAENLYKEWFVRFRFPGYETAKLIDTRLGKIPFGFSVIQMNDAFEYYIGGGWGEDNYSEAFPEKAYVIRGTDFPKVQKGDLSTCPLRYHKKSNYAPRELKENDIIIEVSGGTAEQPVGRTLIVNKDVLDRLGNKVICASFCKLIRLNTEVVAPYYFYYWMQFLYNTRVIDRFQLQSTGIINFKFEYFLRKGDIMLPPRDLMEMFDTKVKTLHEQISLLSKQNENLIKQRDLLLPRLMSGKLEV